MSNGGTVAIIPARGGSKRLPRKNIYPFFGKPLLQYAIEACQQSRLIDRGVYVSTDDTEIAVIARSLGALVIDRPASLAQDNVWTQDVLQHAVRHLEGIGVEFDTVARVHCSPYVGTDKIDEALEKLKRHKLWEVFSVNAQGIEDAVIHILLKKTVWQQALSVYKGVITTDYQDVHTKEDIEAAERAVIDTIERESLVFLSELERWYDHATLWDELQYILGRPNSLWRWQRVVSLHQRWNSIVSQSPELRNFLSRPDAYRIASTMSVLDLGSGFGMYWPILRRYGFRKFVGIDLFDLRRREHYLQAAQAYVSHFCPDCDTQVVMDDVRNLGQHTLVGEKFDLILNVATTSTKIGSTGIPHGLFEEIVKKYGSERVLPVHIEQAH